MNLRSRNERSAVLFLSRRKLKLLHPICDAAFGAVRRHEMGRALTPPEENAFAAVFKNEE
jgi:hypothetical protein